MLSERCHDGSDSGRNYRKVHTISEDNIKEEKRAKQERHSWHEEVQTSEARIAGDPAIVESNFITVNIKLTELLVGQLCLLGQWLVHTKL